MLILHTRPVLPGGGKFHNVCDFDVEVADGLRLHGLRLALAPDGRRFVFSPAKHGARFASFSGDYARQLADAAYNHHGGHVANDRAA